MAFWSSTSFQEEWGPTPTFEGLDLGALGEAVGPPSWAWIHRPKSVHKPELAALHTICVRMMLVILILFRVPDQPWRVASPPNAQMITPPAPPKPSGSAWDEQSPQTLVGNFHVL